MPADSIPLYNALDFTPDALRANQAGQMTQQQRESLFRRRVKQSHRGVGRALRQILLAPTLLCLGYVALALNFALGTALLIPLGLAILAGRGLELLGVYFQARADKKAGEVAVVSGELKKERAGWSGGRALRCYLDIGAAGFRVRDELLDAFEEGQHYRLYYAPRSMTILAAERRPVVVEAVRRPSTAMSTLTG